jgi:uncharacterized protein (DUF58 family)
MARRKGPKASRGSASGFESTVYGWVRITRFGVAYVLVCLLVSVAAINTGNNALFMVLALLLGALAVSGFSSRSNVRGLRLTVTPPGEVYANRPFSLQFHLESARRRSPHWLLEVTFPGGDHPRLIPYLPAGGKGRGHLELLLTQRGVHTLRRIAVASPFPFGLFEKAKSYPVDVEVLVYPELYGASSPHLPESGTVGEESHRRVGPGHDLHQLRPLRPGDDPRGIHWKQTAKTGEMIFTERQAEHSRRISILLENGVAPLQGEEESRRFEQLVSEAATAAVDLLDRGYQVELVHRGRHLPSGSGRRQRYRILEELALLEPCPPPQRAAPLAAGDPHAPQIRLSLDRSSTSPGGGRDGEVAA